MVDDARIYGDGVNIAARLEAIAEPGGICISDKVHQEIRGKIALRFEDFGPQQLKNIPEPVRVYCIGPDISPTAAPQARPVLALPDKPSIAVLPFTNLSGDPKEGYFSDGITEDIITKPREKRSKYCVLIQSFRLKGLWGVSRSLKTLLIWNAMLTHYEGPDSRSDDQMSSTPAADKCGPVYC